MSFMEIEDTTLSGVKRLCFKKFNDDRGSFIKYFSSEDFKKFGLIHNVKQVNFSFTKKKEQ